MSPPGTGGGGGAAARGLDPVWFALVMATGIVSAALRQAGLPDPAAALLAVAAAAFVILASASCCWAVVHPADLRAGLRRPERAFAWFAFVAACGVLGNGLAGDGHRYAAAVLAGAALAAWLAFTCVIPARLAARPRTRPVITQVNGTWYLWAVGTQSLAIAAAFLATDGLLRPWLAAAAGIAAWSAGVVVYLAVMALVLARLLAAGLGPGDAIAPYWVAMGAASISAFAASRVLHVSGAPAVAAARPVLTGAAVILWAVATGLIPALVTLTVARSFRPPSRPGYRPEAWAIVFPLGMYAMAGMQLGTAAGLPLIRDIGAAAVWPAAAAWALTFAAMTGAPFARRHLRGHEGRLQRGRVTPGEREESAGAVAARYSHVQRCAGSRRPAGEAISPQRTITVRQNGPRNETLQVPGPGHAPPQARQPGSPAARPDLPHGGPGPRS